MAFPKIFFAARQSRLPIIDAAKTVSCFLLRSKTIQVWERHCHGNHDGFCPCQAPFPWSFKLTELISHHWYWHCVVRLETLTACGWYDSHCTSIRWLNWLFCIGHNALVREDRYYGFSAYSHFARWFVYLSFQGGIRNQTGLWNWNRSPFRTRE